MEGASYWPVVWLLGIMGLFVTMLSNLVKHVIRPPGWRPSPADPAASQARRWSRAGLSRRLQGEGANQDLTSVLCLSWVIGTCVAAVLQADIVEILRNPDAPALFFGVTEDGQGGNSPAGAAAIRRWPVIRYAITGAALAYISKFWNDLFDILYDAKRWLRKKAA